MLRPEYHGFRGKTTWWLSLSPIERSDLDASHDIFQAPSHEARLLDTMYKKVHQYFILPYGELGGTRRRGESSSAHVLLPGAFDQKSKPVHHERCRPRLNFYQEVNLSNTEFKK